MEVGAESELEARDIFGSSQRVRERLPELLSARVWTKWRRGLLLRPPSWLLASGRGTNAVSGGGELLGVSFSRTFLFFFFFSPFDPQNCFQLSLISRVIDLHGVSLRTWEYVRDGAERKVIGVV